MIKRHAGIRSEAPGVRGTHIILSPLPSPEKYEGSKDNKLGSNCRKWGVETGVVTKNQDVSPLGRHPSDYSYRYRNSIRKHPDTLRLSLTLDLPFHLPDSSSGPR